MLNAAVMNSAAPVAMKHLRFLFLRRSSWNANFVSSTSLLKLSRLLPSNEHTVAELGLIPSALADSSFLPSLLPCIDDMGDLRGDSSACRMVAVISPLQLLGFSFGMEDIGRVAGMRLALRQIPEHKCLAGTAISAASCGRSVIRATYGTASEVRGEIGG